MSFFSKAFRSIGKLAKGIVSNPLVKMVAGGAALVFPVVGVPALLAIGTADRVLLATKSADAAKRLAAVRLVARTVVQAKKGDPEASRAVALLVKRKRELIAGTGHSPQAVAKALAKKPTPPRRQIVNPFVMVPNGRVAYRNRVARA